VPPALLPPPLSLSLSLGCGRASWHGSAAPRRGLSTSGPRRGGPSSPRHGGCLPVASPRGPIWLPCPSRATTASLLRHAAAASKRRQAAASGELHTLTRLYSPEQQGDVTFSCCKRMFQLFQMFQRYVAKVD
jgi:hypothetical protein